MLVARHRFFSKCRVKLVFLTFNRLRATNINPNKNDWLYQRATCQNHGLPHAIVARQVPCRNLYSNENCSKIFWIHSALRKKSMPRY
jgi:hypothetical protein